MKRIQSLLDIQEKEFEKVSAPEPVLRSGWPLSLRQAAEAQAGGRR